MASSYCAKIYTRLRSRLSFQMVKYQKYPYFGADDRQTAVSTLSEWAGAARIIISAKNREKEETHNLIIWIIIKVDSFLFFSFSV